MKAFIFCLVLSLLSPFANATKSFDELTIAQLQHGVATGQFSYADVTAFYLAKIEQFNPSLNAVIAVNPNAYQDALAKDAAYKTATKGLLYGVPVLLKDNIDTHFMATTAGALALANNIPSANAEIVDNLIAQGAIILGKANLSEWANFKSMKSTSGFSAVGGQTRNPFNRDYSPCGSSSGSAVALTANMSLVSIGTETDGSIHCPAAMASVVGFKPTLSHVSQKGIIPIAHSQDTAGPMARTVADAALVYYAMAGQTPKTHNKALKQARIGLFSSLYDFNRKSKTLFEAKLAALNKAGVTVIDDLSFANLDEVYNAEFDILLYEFNQDVTAYLQSTPSAVSVKSLAQLVEYNSALGDNKQDLLQSSLAGPTKERYLSAKKTIDTVAKQQLSALFDKHKLDVIIAPTVGATWKIDPEYGDKFSGSSTTFAAVSGYPSIAIPIGLSHGMPYSISIIGRYGDDAALLNLAAQIESLIGERAIPKLVDQTQ